MASLDRDSEKMPYLRASSFNLLLPDGRMFDDGKTSSARLEQMIMDLSRWSALFTICPHCNHLFLMCPWCDHLFSDHENIKTHGHECPGVAK